MPCKSCGKDSGKFYKGSCPECLMGRVQELEQRVVDMRDRVLLERERREQVEAQAAMMRKALEYVALWLERRPNLSSTLDAEVKREAYTKIRAALAALDGDGKKGGENEHVAYTNPAPTF